MAEDLQPIAFSSHPGHGDAEKTAAAYADPKVGATNVTDDGMNENNDN